MFTGMNGLISPNQINSNVCHATKNMQYFVKEGKENKRKVKPLRIQKK